MICLKNLDPIAFEIGSLSVRWYGIFITLAILIGYSVACFNAKKRG
ncbi:MAG: prolipoprotein diacylglyceryl transferase, partial [Clostridia bacterium]|nr:prolipoprotein diacylglyceryl transferase [Clostridia bacterium]